MIEFAPGHPRLNYRVAGICLHDGHVLLQQMGGEAIWALPGGRPAFGETSRDALVREMREEIDVDVEVGRLLWVMENFFAYEGEPFHELGFYYLMTLPGHPGFAADHRSIIGHEGDQLLIFRWFPLGQLPDLPLYPEFLRTALTDLPDCPTHVVHVDD